MSLGDLASVAASVERSPWADATAFRSVIVGGVFLEQWGPVTVAYGHSRQGHRVDKFYKRCGVYDTQTQDAHTARFEGVVAGTDTVLSTDDVEYSLSCEVWVDYVAGAAADADAGTDSGASPDSGDTPAARAAGVEIPPPTPARLVRLRECPRRDCRGLAWCC